MTQLKFIRSSLLAISVYLVFAVQPVWSMGCGAFLDNAIADLATEFTHMFPRFARDFSEPQAGFDFQRLIWHLRDKGEFEEANAIEQRLATTLRTYSEQGRFKITEGGNFKVGISFNHQIRGIYKASGIFGGQNEIAAYVLDRLLDINIVPVTISRYFNVKYEMSKHYNDPIAHLHYSQTPGSLQFWLEDGVPLNKYEGQIPEQSMRDARFLAFLLYKFDWDYDTNLIIMPSGRIAMIDNSISFERQNMAEEFSSAPDLLALPAEVLKPSPRILSRFKSTSDFQYRSALSPYLAKEDIDEFLVRKNYLMRLFFELPKALSASGN